VSESENASTEECTPTLHLWVHSETPPKGLQGRKREVQGARAMNAAEIIPSASLSRSLTSETVPEDVAQSLQQQPASRPLLLIAQIIIYPFRKLGKFSARRGV
jgi:hypothetical protein